MEMATLIPFIVALLLKTGYSTALEVTLKNSGPAVRGANVTFTASVSYYSGKLLKYVYDDNASPQHKSEFESSDKTVNWSIEYTRSYYEAGQYIMTLNVKEYIFGIWINAATVRTAFNLTDTLHGRLMLNQNAEERPNDFVAANQTVTHSVLISDSDLQFLKKNSSSIHTYWFLDCTLLEIRNDFSLDYTYKDTMSSHDIEAIVIANNEPLTTTTTTTSTTTTTTTTTTPKPNTTSSSPPASASQLPTSTSQLPTSTSQTPTSTSQLPTSTSQLPPSTSQMPSTTILLTSKSSSENPMTTKNVINNISPSLSPVHKVKKRSISNRTTMKNIRGSCANELPVGPGRTVGRYQRIISVREPISAINIAGHNWLQHGDLLSLTASYGGSPPFDYCILYKIGQYNITGNETCRERARTLSNTFPIVHYFPDSDQHTVVVVIQNEIGNSTSKATINIYKVSVHGQLSVIVVPVFFCLVAVILVVFGIAYYQHRSRHSVEVADFDFGQAHLDYKTFTERLRDSFKNAFNFRHRDDTDPLTNNTRYDSMT